MQKTFEDLSRGHRGRPCAHLVRTEASGCVNRDEGLVILGRCGLLGGTAYDRRCETCDSREESE